MMPTTGAIFVSNPGKLRRSRRNGLAVRANTHALLRTLYRKYKRGLPKSERTKLGLHKRFYSAIGYTPGSKKKGAFAAWRKGSHSGFVAELLGNRTRRRQAYAVNRKVARDAKRSARKARRAAAPRRSKRVRAAQRRGGVSRSVRKAMRASIGLTGLAGASFGLSKAGKPLTAAQAAFAARARSRRKAVANGRGSRGRSFFGRKYNFSVKRNGFDSIVPGVSTLQGLVGRVPLVGRYLASPVGMGVGAAVGLLAGSWLNNRYVVPAIGGYVPPMLAPVTGTITGGAAYAVASLVAGFAPGTIGTVIRTVGLLAGAAGVASDVFRFAASKGFALGDGMAYDLTPMSGLAVNMNGISALGPMHGLAVNMNGIAAMAGETAEYADATGADAMYCGADLDSVEGDAALAGPRQWFRTFGPPNRRAAGPAQPQSRHAGRAGHRWGWLIKLVGFENFQKIVALAPERRVAVIHTLRQQAVEALPRMIETANAVIPPNIAAEAQAQNLGGYGALMFAGSGM